MNVVLTTNRSIDRNLLDSALVEAEGSPGDVVQFGSAFRLLRHLYTRTTDLVVLGLPASELLEEDLLADLQTVAPTVPVVLLVDGDEGGRLEEVLIPRPQRTW